MAFKFNAILKFTGDQFKKGLKDSNRSLATFKSGLSDVNRGLTSIGAGLRSAAIATAPFALATGNAIRVASGFEAQMSTVQSVLLATSEEMKPLTALVKELGATTSFTAIQVGEAGEALSRAGLSVEETMGALPGTLRAAEAAGIGVGEAAQLVSKNMKAFNIDATKASEVADTLALTTARTNTDMTQLGEALKLAAPAANQAEISLSQTATTLGILANAGLQGGIGGTAVKNALLQLSKPSEKVLKLFGGRKGLNEALIEVGENGEKRLRPMEVVMANINEVVSKAPDPLQAAGQAAEIFGLRGAQAFSSFQAQMSGTTEVTEKNIKALRLGVQETGEELEVSLGDQIPTLRALRLEIAGASGASEKMARIKLDNLRGDLTKLNSAFEGLNIEIGGVLTGSLRPLIQTLTDGLSLVVKGFQLVGGSTEDVSKALGKLQEDGNKFSKFLPQAIEFAEGFAQGFEKVKEFVVLAFNEIKKVFQEFFGDTELSNKQIGRLVGQFVLLASIAAPILAGISAAIFVIAPIIAAIGGAFLVVIGIVKIVGAVVLSKAAAVAAALAAVILVVTSITSGILEIKNRFSEVVEAFQQEGLLAGLSKSFEVFFDGVKKPFNFLIEKFKETFGFVTKISDAISKFASKSANILGFDVGTQETAPVETQSRVLQQTLTPEASGVLGVPNSTQGNEDLRRGITERRASVQPPSATDIAQENARLSRSQQGRGETQPGAMKVQVEVKGKLRGNDINIASARSKLRNAEANGRNIDPTTRQRVQRNGEALVGVQ